ncbi:GDP/GTP exchange factor for ARF, partial [Spiromyces aspiralis]
MMNPPSTSDPVYSKRPARGQQQHSRPLTPRMERTRSEQSTTPEAPSVGTAGEGASAEAHYAPQYSPYSTPAILEVFSVLVQLLNPRDLKFTDTMRLMALNALIIAFNSAGSAMSGYSSFRVIALNSLCHHLLQILAGNQVNLIPAAFRLLTLLFSTHKKYCKAQIELFICQTVGRLMGPVPPAADYNVGTPNDNRESPVKQQAKSPTLDRQHSEHTLPKHPGGDAETLAMSFTSFEPASFKRLTYQEQLALYCAMSLKRGVRGKIASGQVRQLLLEGFHHMMTSDEAFLADLWVNYDCDHRHGNLCDFLVAFITHNAIPPTGGDGQGDAYGSGGAGGGNGSSGGGGDSWGASNEYEAYQDMLMYHIGHMLRRAQRRQHHQITKKENSSWLPPVERLLRQKKYKDDTTHAAMRFNQKPKEGIAYLQRIGYLPAENSSDMVAKLVRFLKQAPTLDKSLVGEYLAKPSNTEVLQTYISTFDFNDRRLEEALRMILGTFRLPGESQQIERIMETFATAFFETSPEGIATKDAAFVLAFAVIMLNTDQHSPQVKSRMKFSDFCRNLRGVNGGNDFSHEFLEATYEAIRQREIVFPEEHEGEAGFEYAWKEMWSRDEPMVVHSLDLARNDNAEDDSSTPVWLSTAAAASAEQYLVEYDSVLFKAMWPRLLSVAANTLVRSNCDYLLLLALQAYQCVAELGASYGDTLCMSTTVSHLVDVCGGMSPALIKDIDRPQILFVDEHGRQKVVDTNRLYLIDSTFP